MGLRGPEPIFSAVLHVKVRPECKQDLQRLSAVRGASVSSLVRAAIDAMPWDDLRAHTERRDHRDNAAA